MKIKVLILILENANKKQSMEFNYFSYIKSNLNELKNKKILNKNLDKIWIEKVKTNSKNFLENFNLQITKPNIIFGIIDNDDEIQFNKAKENFFKIFEMKFKNFNLGINKKDFHLIYPPEKLSFEYYLTLHIFESNKICLEKNIIKNNLKNFFNLKSLKDIKKQDNKISEKCLKSKDLLNNLKNNYKKHNKNTYYKLIECLFNL